jgi:anti-anti-sigma factor
VIVDLEEVEFISSAGAGSLVGNVEAFRSRGGDLIICNATDTVLHVFNILDLSDYLTIKTDLSQATSSLPTGK